MFYSGTRISSKEVCYILQFNVSYLRSRLLQFPNPILSWNQAAHNQRLSYQSNVPDSYRIQFVNNFYNKIKKEILSRIINTSCWSKFTSLNSFRFSPDLFLDSALKVRNTNCSSGCTVNRLFRWNLFSSVRDNCSASTNSGDWLWIRQECLQKYGSCCCLEGE